MPKSRSFLIFTVSFAVVLLAGVALAHVGALAPPVETDEIASGPALAAPDEWYEPEGEGELAQETPGTEGGNEESDHLEEAAYDKEAEAEVPIEIEPIPDEAGHPEQGVEPEAVIEPNHEEDTTPPLLEILFPVNGQHVETEVLAFEGITEPGATVKAGPYEADVNAEGEWRIVLYLEPGGNRAGFVATDEAGNVSDASVTVYFDTPEKPGEGESEEVQKEWDFVAKQKYGSCAEPVPYDIFYGYARPGSAIWVESPFGGGVTEAGPEGGWELRVEFPEAPFNEPFEVVVEDSDGHFKVFGFVRTEGEGKDK